MPTYRVGTNVYAVVNRVGRHSGGAANVAGTWYGQQRAGITVITCPPSLLQQSRAIEHPTEVALGEVTLAGIAAGISTAAGALTVDHTLVGVSAGVSTAAGALSVTYSLAGIAAGTSTVSGALAVTHALAATSAGVAAVTGDLTIGASGPAADYKTCPITILRRR